MFGRGTVVSSDVLVILNERNEYYEKEKDPESIIKNTEWRNLS